MPVPILLAGGLLIQWLCIYQVQRIIQAKRWAEIEGGHSLGCLCQSHVLLFVALWHLLLNRDHLPTVPMYLLKNTHFIKPLKSLAKYASSLVQKHCSTSFCYSFFPAEGKSFHWFWLAGSNFSFTSSEFTIHCKDPQIKWKQTEPSGETLSINNILFTLMKALSEWKGPGCWLFPDTAVWNLEEELLHHFLSEFFLKQIQSYWLKKIILSFNQAINLLDNFATISRNTWLVKSERHGILTYLTLSVLHSSR